MRSRLQIRWLDGITDSLHMILSKLREIVKDRKPDVLQFMRLQRVGQDLATEQQQYSTVYMYYLFFIHSSVGGYLGCFHVLTVVNSAAVNTEVHVSF